MIAGGVTELKATGSSAYDSEDADFKHSAGIKGDKGVVVSGGKLTVTSTGTAGRGIASDGYVFISGCDITMNISGGVVYDSTDSEYKGTAGIKEMLDDMHKRKIDMADEIYVINVGGYIGESTRSEFEYAKKNGRGVRYLEEESA